MRLETKIATLLMLAALALGSCTKKPHTPTEDPQPVGFTAMSQVAVTKATTPLSQYHQDFGVWGIATATNTPPYVLWDNDNLSPVVKESGSNVFVPTSDAYWLAGYTYHFMALAPYNSGATGFSIHNTNHTMAFNFSMASKYDAAAPDTHDPDFDLMGAVGKNGPIGATKPEHQNLVFWHLLSRINITVKFVDANGTERSGAGTVSEMRLKNVDAESSYVLSFNGEDALAVSCASNRTGAQTDITFTSGTETLHIIPQTISDLELYLDFTLDGASYKDFKVNLAVTGNPTEYRYNDQYNWNINIGPKAAIGFTVTVTPWNEEQVGDDVTIM